LHLFIYLFIVLEILLFDIAIAFITDKL